MLSPNLILDLNREIFVDNFAGGGGASTGIERALGRHVDHAINHDWAALGMHRINHPQTVHHCEDVFDVDPRVIAGKRRVGGGWFSPDCKHFSKAKGGKPLSKKIRGLAFVMLRWAKLRTRVIYMENVEEIQTWGPLLHHPEHPKDCTCQKPCGKADPAHKGRTWQAFLAALRNGVAADHPDLAEMLAVLNGTPEEPQKCSFKVTREELIQGFGYQVETKTIRALVYGTGTIRNRLYMIGRCDGMPIVWPEPTHGTALDRRESGKRLKRAVPAAVHIDWSIRCHSIFLTKAQARRVRCKRPLVRATKQRVAFGVDRYVLKAARPFIVNQTHQGGMRVESIDEPIKTLTAAHRGEKALVDCELAPFITEHANASNQRNMPIDEPLRTQCAQVKGGHFALAAASLVRLQGDAETHAPGQPVDECGPTVCAGGQHHGLSLVYLAQHNAGGNTNPGHSLHDSISTISSKGSQQQLVFANAVAYYGCDKEGQAVSESLRTVTVKERFGLVQSHAVSQELTPAQLAGARRVAKFLRSYGVVFEGEFATVKGYVIVDIGMRMLTPRELFRCQGFPEAYVIDRAWVVNPHTGEIEEVKLTKEQQIRMCGNSVCPPVAEALVRANSPDMAIGRIKKAEGRRQKAEVAA